MTRIIPDVHRSTRFLSCIGALLLAGCSQTGGSSVPTQEQYDSLNLNMTLPAADTRLGGPGTKIASEDVPDIPAKDTPGRTIMERLDFYRWGPGGDNVLVLGVTRDKPPRVKHIVYRAKTETSHTSTGKTTPYNVVKEAGSDQVTNVEWVE